MKRLWSGRRVVASLTGLIILSSSIFALVELARVQVFDRQPLLASWYQRVESWLANHHWDHIAVLMGSGFIALLGLTLIFVAFTPGNRSFLAIRPSPQGSDASLEVPQNDPEVVRCYALRSGLARWIATEVARMEEVTDTRVAVTRRRVRIFVRHPLEINSAELQPRVQEVSTAAIRVWGLTHSARIVLRPDRRPA